jgi:hypothetical protein
MNSLISIYENTNTTDFKVTKRFFSGIKIKDKKDVMHIIKTTETSNELINLLDNIFYRVYVVPTTDEDIEIEINKGCWYIQSIKTNKNKCKDSEVYLNYYKTDELKLITIIELQKANIECYDYDVNTHNNKILDLFYDKIKKYFETVVLDKFRQWSKKRSRCSRRERRREKKNLPLFHFPIRKYFKEHITEELIMTVMHPRNFGRLWHFDDF